MTAETLEEAKLLDADLNILNEILSYGREECKICEVCDYEQWGDGDISEGYVQGFSRSFQDEFWDWLESKKKEYEERLKNL